MAKGYSLHVGVNRVDPDQYEGWDGALTACEFDAKDMWAIAKKRGFQSPRLLLSEGATSSAVMAAVRDAADALAKGDIFWLTYSGHGGQVPDTNGDEKDKGRMDETWVLYDRMLVDDELYALWRRFKPGVRILVLSDSCHSGSVVRNIPPFIDGRPAHRAMPRRVNDRVYDAHRRQYSSIQKSIQAAEVAKVRASVLLISGCQDNQYSLDGDRNGAFTGALKRVWKGGKFQGTYRKFRDLIAMQLPDSQTPNYYRAGATSSTFEAQKPFSV